MVASAVDGGMLHRNRDEGTDIDELRVWRRSDSLPAVKGYHTSGICVHVSMAAGCGIFTQRSIARGLLLYSIWQRYTQEQHQRRKAESALLRGGEETMMYEGQGSQNEGECACLALTGDISRRDGLRMHTRLGRPATLTIVPQKELKVQSCTTNS